MPVIIFDFCVPHLAIFISHFTKIIPSPSDKALVFELTATSALATLNLCYLRKPRQPPGPQIIILLFCVTPN